jgi:putative ABC transport system permease protein
MQNRSELKTKLLRFSLRADDPSKQDEVAARILERFKQDQLLFTRDLPEFVCDRCARVECVPQRGGGRGRRDQYLVILLAMYTTVTERTRQIGILKSLVMSKTSIAWVIEQEAIIVSVLGVVVGVLLTMLAQLVVTRTTSLLIEIEPTVGADCVGCWVVGWKYRALYPALRAARQDAVEALSYDK